MARKKDGAATKEIQQLLDERKRIEQWLERLGKAADRTPEGVRERVREDYERRLDAVVTELKGYEADIRASLDDVRSRHAAAREQEGAATEELAEAELRHAVGEFEESEWSEKKSTILDRLIGIREELGETEEEIAELDEVLTSITAPVDRTSVPEMEEPAAAEAPAVPEIAELDDEAIEDVPEPPPAKPAKGADRLSLGADLGLRDLQGGEPVKGGDKAKAKSKSGLGDELEFLKALGDQDGGEQKKATAKAAKAERAPAGPKAVEQLNESTPRSRPSVINQRTLKCGECGAMNLPTEWYCDRCGAELASL